MVDYCVYLSELQDSVPKSDAYYSFKLEAYDKPCLSDFDNMRHGMCRHEAKIRCYVDCYLTNNIDLVEDF